MFAIIRGIKEMKDECEKNACGFSGLRVNLRHFATVYKLVKRKRFAGHLHRSHFAFFSLYTLS